MAMSSSGAARSILAACIWLALGGGGCSSGNPGSKLAEPPTLASAHCRLVPRASRPLIVEWSGADRGSLELRLQQGLVVVRYEGCELEVLRHCQVPGEYAYSGFNRKHDTVAIHGVDDLFTQMPIGAPP